MWKILPTISSFLLSNVKDIDLNQFLSVKLCERYWLKSVTFYLAMWKILPSISYFLLSNVKDIALNQLLYIKQCERYCLQSVPFY